MYITRHLLASALLAAVALPSMAQQKPETEKIVRGPVIEQVSSTDATIAWATSTGGSSLVKYGTSPTDLNETAQSPYLKEKDADDNPVHRVHLKGLRPNTTYYYEVVSGHGQGTGTASQSHVAEFKTKGEGQERSEAEKIIAGPKIEQVSNDSATIAWQTNTGGSSVIRYGSNPNHLDESAQSPYVDQEGAKFQVHRVQLKNLKPNTTYYYAVISGHGEGTGTSAQSQVAQFTTKGEGQERSEAEKIIAGPKIEQVSNDSATIAWQTNTGGSSIIRYGSAPNHLDQTAQSPYTDQEGAKFQVHRVQLKNLKPNTTYYYAVISGHGEGTGTSAQSQVEQFKTR